MIVLLIVIYSCSKIVSSTNNLYNDNSYVDNKYIFEHKALIAFNGGFNDDNERVKVSQGNFICYDGIEKTDNRTGLAKGINIDEIQTDVYFYSINKSFKLKEKYMKKYKFVNISKENGKYYIEFTNRKKTYM